MGILPDGTGRRTQASAFRGSRSQTDFQWKPAGEFTVNLRLAEPGEPWETVRYDFKAVSTDTGEEIALIEVREVAREFEGFWIGTAPLAYCGPVE